MKNNAVNEASTVLEVQSVRVWSGKCPLNQFDHVANSFLTKNGFVKLKVDELDPGHIQASVDPSLRIYLEYSVPADRMVGPFRLFSIERNISKEIDDGLTSYIQAATAEDKNIEINAFGTKIGTWEFHCLAGNVGISDLKGDTKKTKHPDAQENENRPEDS